MVEVDLTPARVADSGRRRFVNTVPSLKGLGSFSCANPARRGVLGYDCDALRADGWPVTLGSADPSTQVLGDPVGWRGTNGGAPH